jgi:hypothetical protein
LSLFIRRDDAERFLERVRADEPELADRLRLEPVDLDQPATGDARRRAALRFPPWR